MALPPEPEGPHQLPYRERESCAVEGRLIDGSGVCNVVAISDRKRRGWVLYPHGVASFGVLITYNAASTLAHRIIG